MYIVTTKSTTWSYILIDVQDGANINTTHMEVWDGTNISADNSNQIETLTAFCVFIESVACRMFLTVLSVCGVVGNMVSLLALSRMPRPRTAFHIMLINVAASDFVSMVFYFLLGIMMLIERPTCSTRRAASIWVVLNDISYSSLVCTIWAMFGLVVCQYVSTKTPFYCGKSTSKTHAKIYILTTWIASIIFISVVTIGPTVTGNEKLFLIFTVCVFLISFVITTLAVVYMYWKMLKYVRRGPPTLGSNNENNGERSNLKARKTVAILAVVMLLFWAPGITNICIVFLDWFTTVTLSREFSTLSLIGNVLFIFNSVVNPLIYGVRLNIVRKGYARLFACGRRNEL